MPEQDTLDSVTKRYLAAMESHTLADAPLAASFRGTENGIVVKIGEGLWRSIEKFASSHIFTDAESKEVVTIGALQSQGTLYPYALRLKIVDEEITESEFLRSSSTHGHFAAVEELLKPDVIYDAPVPAERACRSREELRGVADRYWIALGESDGTLAKFSSRCDRYANGKKITNNLALLLSPDAAVHTPASLLTATRPARPKVLERRFSVLDIERGLAISFALVKFQPSGGRKDFGYFYICGLVKVVDDEFRNIDHIHEILPQDTAAVSGW